MTIDEIRELIQVVKETGIAQLVVQRGSDSVTIVGAIMPSQERVVPVSTVMPVNVSALPSISTYPAGGQLESVSSLGLPTAASEETEHDILVKSPIVGTYYDSPSPDSPKFVKIGDRVEPKQVLCIIESMKLMNEIEAEIAGIVIAKYIDNGRPVEYGELLFSIQPLK